jgi:para-nitrobenzyl esterase
MIGSGPGPAHMASQIGGAWVAFARTGKPDHPGIPHWPPLDTTQRPVMVFDTTSKVVDDPLQQVRAVLDSVPPGAMIMIMR